MLFVDNFNCNDSFIAGSIGWCIALDQTSYSPFVWVDLGSDSFGWWLLVYDVSLFFNTSNILTAFADNIIKYLALL